VRYAVFGDIHGNLDALEAVLAEIERLGADALICLGDIVGYGAEPRECIARVRELECLTLAGNHDHAAIGKLDVEFFNPFAREAAMWTREELSDEDRDYLASLGFVEHVDGFAVAHGSLHGPELFNYVQSIHDAELSLEALDKPLLLVGHTHVPLTFFDSRPMTYSMDLEIPVDPKSRTIANVGSVGQPRDEDPRACFGLYDTDDAQVTLYRVPYDVEAAGRKIVDAGLPEALALRLQLGK